MQHLLLPQSDFLLFPSDSLRPTGQSNTRLSYTSDPLNTIVPTLISLCSTNSCVLYNALVTWPFLTSLFQGLPQTPAIVLLSLHLTQQHAGIAHVSVTVTYLHLARRLLTLSREFCLATLFSLFRFGSSAGIPRTNLTVTVREGPITCPA